MRVNHNGKPVRLVDVDGRIFASRDGMLEELDRSALERPGGLVSELCRVFPVTPQPEEIPCRHPDACYIGDEAGKSCQGRPFVRERWTCPDCHLEWYEAVRWTD